jgi:hypothetical protein
VHFVGYSLHKRFMFSVHLSQTYPLNTYPLNTVSVITVHKYLRSLFLSQKSVRFPTIKWITPIPKGRFWRTLELYLLRVLFDHTHMERVLCWFISYTPSVSAPLTWGCIPHTEFIKYPYFLIWVAHCVWQDEDRGRIDRYKISSMVWASVEEHRRLKKREDIK